MKIWNNEIKISSFTRLNTLFIIGLVSNIWWTNYWMAPTPAAAPSQRLPLNPYRCHMHAGALSTSEASEDSPVPAPKKKKKRKQYQMRNQKKNNIANQLASTSATTPATCEQKTAPTAPATATTYHFSSTVLTGDPGSVSIEYGGLRYWANSLVVVARGLCVPSFLDFVRSLAVNLLFTTSTSQLFHLQALSAVRGRNYVTYYPLLDNRL